MILKSSSLFIRLSLLVHLLRMPIWTLASFLLAIGIYHFLGINRCKSEVVNNIYIKRSRC